MSIATHTATNLRDQLSSALEHKDVLSTRVIFQELNPHLKTSPIFNKPVEEYREAAILFPIIDRAEEPTVLLTVRSNDMPSHAGQISFPGGRVAEADENLIATALRETHEEVGIEDRHVEVIGDMGVHLGGMGWAVTPIIGIIHPDTDFSPCPREVQSVFEVPLSYALNLDNHIIEERQHSGVQYRMPAIPYEEYHIWGLTAGIINTLSRAMG